LAASTLELQLPFRESGDEAAAKATKVAIRGDLARLFQWLVPFWSPARGAAIDASGALRSLS